MSPASSPDSRLLHHHPNLAPLVRLLAPHLPHALPLYSTLQTEGVATPVYASFACGEEAGPPFLILADMGNQLRFFCSAETSVDLSAAEKAEAEELVVSSLRWYLREHPRGRPDIRIGAIPDIWTDAVAGAFTKPFYPSNIHYQPLPSISTVEAGEGSPALAFPDDVSVLPAEERHIEQILSTSDVPHPPSYILSRLPHTTTLFATPSADPTLPHFSSSSSTTTRVASSPPTSPSPALIAHCITHRDGSIGTVFVAPSFRRVGLGAALLKQRMREMASASASSAGEDEAGEEEQRFAYCYVSPANEKSRALMRRIGMRMTEWCVSWAVVQLPLEE
ncbi:hypothetical protein JCM8097_001622 [Rhodosporidiobolus ruineniae]